MLYQERKTLLPAIGGTLIIVFSLVLALSHVAKAQAQPVPPQGSSMTIGGITVVGNGTISLEPDIARATIGVEAINESVREASDEAESRMGALLEALVDQGIAENDIQTTGYSIYSERGMGNDPEALRYRVSNQVEVTIRDLDSVGPVLDVAIDAGANQIHGVQFDLDDPTVYEGEARAEAIADARAKAQELAELTEVTLGPVINVSEIIGDVGIPMMGAEMMVADGRGGGTPIVPGEFDLTVRIQVTYGLSAASGEATLPPDNQQAPAVEVAPDDAVSEGIAGEEAVPIEEGTGVAGSSWATPQSARIVDMPTLGEMPTVTVEGGDEAALRRYLEATLQPLYPGMRMTAITVTIGDLPAQLPFELDLPGELEVVGASVREGDYGSTDIILAGPAPVEEWTEQLREQLLDQDFFAPETTFAGGNPVFQSERPGAEMVLCSEDRTLMVNMVAGEVDGDAIIRVVLNTQAVRGSMCDPGMQAPGGPPTQWMPEGLLPTLQAPEGALLQGMGSSGSDRSFEVNAQIQTDELNAQEIFEHWTPVLEEEGWELTSETTANGAVAWSLWTREFEGNTWSSVFYIMRQSADESHYTATLRIERN